MTTVNDFVDILRIIREQPEWAEALRAALLSREVLELPQRLAEFSQTAERRFASLGSDVADLKADVADLKIGQSRLEGDVADLKVGQSRLEGDVVELKAGQSRLEVAVGNLEVSVGNLQVAVGDLQVAVGNLQGTVGNLQGSAYEQKIGNNIAGIVGQHLSIRRVRVMKGYKTSDEMAFYDIIDSAEDRGDISTPERWEASNTDIVLQGTKQPDRSNVYVAIEVSVSVAEGDISRAASRAEILRRATGEEVIPAVVGATADDSRRQLAEARSVALIDVGQ